MEGNLYHQKNLAHNFSQFATIEIGIEESPAAGMAGLFSARKIKIDFKIALI